MYAPTLTTFLTLGLVLLAGASAQDLVKALQADPDLSTLLSAISAVPGLAERLDDAEDITIFAPINSAFSAVAPDTMEGRAIAAGDVQGIESILSYHVVGSTIPSGAIQKDAQYVQTLLQPGQLINGAPATLVPGGQFVGARLDGGDVVLMSGNLAMSKVTQADIVVGGATIHKIDSVLTLPRNATMTAATAGLNGIASALSAAEVGALFDLAPGSTVFIPSDQAFDDASGVTASLSQNQLRTVLLLHVAVGSVVYSGDLRGRRRRTSVDAALGESVSLGRDSETGAVSVGAGAEVVVPDVILLNGVGHVISQILIPTSLGGDTNG